MNPSKQINPDTVRPTTNASIFTDNSLGMTKRSMISTGANQIAGLSNVGINNGGLVSSRKQGSIQP